MQAGSTPAEHLRRGPRDACDPGGWRRASLRASAMECPTRSLMLPVLIARADALDADRDVRGPSK
jgi:hypothetical protein